MTQEEKIKVLQDLCYDVQVIDGKPIIKGSLCLDSDNKEITSLPDDLVVTGFLFIKSPTITSLPNNLVVGGVLDIKECSNITSLPDNLVVGGNLYLTDTNIESLPKNLIVGGSLYLSGLKITSLPEILAVGEQIDAINTGITSLPDNLAVNGWLDLSGTKITSLPKNLIVDDWLDISDTGVTSLPEDLLIGGSLYFENTNITSFPDRLVVGGYVYNRYREVIDINQDINVDFVEKIWGNKPYCKVDGIFTEVVERKGKVWKVRKIGETETFYIVNDGNGHYAHGDTIEAAKADLIYKITNKNKSDYEDLTLESVLTHEDAIQCYRVITGACSFGTKNFVENILPQNELKDQYTIAEIIQLTEGQYGNKTFAKFFKNNKQQ